MTQTNGIYFTTEISILKRFLFVFSLLELKPKTLVTGVPALCLSGLWGGSASECVHICIDRATVSLRSSSL